MVFLAASDQAASQMPQGVEPQQGAELSITTEGNQKQQSAENSIAVQGIPEQQSVEHRSARQGIEEQQSAEYVRATEGDNATQGRKEQQGGVMSKHERGLLHGMSAAGSARLLRLASTSAHDVHLHIFAALQTAVQRSEPDTSSLSFTQRLASVIEKCGMLCAFYEQISQQQQEELQLQQRQAMSPQQEQEQRQGMQHYQLKQQQHQLQQVLQQLRLQEQVQQQEYHQLPSQEQVQEQAQQQQQLLLRELVQEQAQQQQQQLLLPEQLQLQQVEEQHQGVQQQLLLLQQVELKVGLLYKHMLQQQRQEWLSALFYPWLTAAPSSPALNRITAIWFHEVQLASPFPDCVGLACPCLRQLELASVTFSTPLGGELATGPQLQSCQQQPHDGHSGCSTAGSSTPGCSTVVPWPQLQRLAISYTDCTHVAPLVTPTKFPALCLFWVEQFGFTDSEAEAVVQCCRRLCKQITSLHIHMIPDDTSSDTSSSDGQITYSLVDKAVYPNLAQLQLPVCNTGDREMQALLTAAPGLQQLTVCSFLLSYSHSDRQWALQKIHVLQGDEPAGVGIIRTLPKLPLMPQLRQVRVEWGLHVSIHKIRLETLSAAVRTGLLERMEVEDGRLELVFEGGNRWFNDTDVSSEEEGSSDDDDNRGLQSSQSLLHQGVTLQKLTLLRPLIRSAEIIHITEAHITPDLLHALHVVQACQVILHRCTWDDTAVSMFWTTMPGISDLRIVDEMEGEQLRALCMAASRPVAVMVGFWFDPEDFEPLMSFVQANGSLATLTRV